MICGGTGESKEATAEVNGLRAEMKKEDGNMAPGNPEATHFKTRKLCGGTGESKEATAEVQELVNGLRAEMEKEVGNMAPGNLEATHFKTQVVWSRKGS